MKCNIGKTDRVIRVLAAIAISGLGIYYGSWWGLVGAVPLLTAITGFCPLYVPLKISTSKCHCSCHEEEDPEKTVAQ